MTDLAKNTPDVAKAYARIKPYIHKTPLLHSNLLNEMLGSKIYFKMDCSNQVDKITLFKEYLEKHSFRNRTMDNG